MTVAEPGQARVSFLGLGLMGLPMGPEPGALANLVS
jgi:hypothetical protein